MTKLLISKKDIKVKTILDGNIDENKFLQFVEIAQDINLQSYLGTDLLEKMLSFVGGTFTTPYDTLLEYVKPVLIHWAMVKYLPFSPYQVSNGGAFKRTSENSESITKEELEMLVSKQADLAQYYSERLIKHLCSNSSDYAEYTTNTEDDIHPEREAYFTGWVL